MDLKKSLILLVFSLCLLQSLNARHIAGGEMSYTYVGPGSGSNSGLYRITLRLYRDCQSSGAQLDTRAAITVYQNGLSGIYRDLQVDISRTDVLQLSTPGPCIDNAPTVCYQVGIYTTDVELPFSPNGYTIAYQRCCRIDNISNILNSGGAGSTYMATIPGLSVATDAPKNSSPAFRGKDTVLICEDNYFTYDFSASDADGDSLAYVFEEAYDYTQNGTPQPTTALPPPYNSVSYGFGFSAGQPMGPDIRLNVNSGIMSGIAPLTGIYVVTVSVLEYRKGILINRHRKDLHIKVANCSIAAATLDPTYITCDGYTLTFQNNNSSPLIKSFFWKFTGAGNFADSSTQERPTYTFPDTGVYKVMLITNRLDDCSDTGYAEARVFPGFFPGFEVDGSCKNVPLNFKDTTKTKYGVVSYWRWSFGSPSINPDTSRLQNPVYTYTENKTYDVQLIVANSKGCRDTIDKQISVLEKPTLRVTNDTVLCYLDDLQLNAQGSGTFSWSPAAGLSDPNIPNPVAKPSVSTKYYVKLTAAPGCENLDSVFIDLKRSVSLEAGNDTTICLTDTFRLRPLSDGLTYQWEPAAAVSDPTAKNPLARPTGTTIFQVKASIGSCSASDGFRVTTIPYPRITISDDTTICLGDSVYLQASGGVDYRWIPPTGLSDNSIPNPYAKPAQTTVYKVAVRDNSGCPKATFDSVTIKVIPPVRAFAGNDTILVVGQPLKMNATGGDYYLWSPSTGLNDVNIPDPTAVLDADISYILKVTTVDGCFDYDTLNVRIFKTLPDIFVPTAFTPNGDRLNDVLIPITAGITKLDFFRIYNRWGELVFSTSEFGKGWDGRIGGRDQGNDTFVWHVRGVDFTGRIIEKKGTSTIIR
jgi:gliding motility-associated-like protein